MYYVDKLDKNYHNITVAWSNDGAEDTEYVLSTANSSTEIPFSKPEIRVIAHNNSVNLALRVGVGYEISVIAQRCGGNLTSNSSNVLSILFPGIVAARAHHHWHLQHYYCNSLCHYYNSIIACSM